MASSIFSLCNNPKGAYLLPWLHMKDMKPW